MPTAEAARNPVAAPELDGIFVLNKPPGPTSHDVVAIVRRLTGVRRVGHGGTLDPFASGVLPVFVGRATRMVEYHMADEKSYRATVVFGASSTTDDLDGEITPSDSPAPSRAAVEDALGRFQGEIEQVPPDYSAVRIAGRRAYELARRGEKPTLRARLVRILELDLVAWDDTEPSRPTATLEVRCTAGTYIRALCRDLGAAVGSAAYLAALTRTQSGPFRLQDAHSLGTAREALAAGRARGLLLPPDTGLDAYPRLVLDAAGLRALSRGQPVRHQPADAGRPEDGAIMRLVDERGRLAAMARLEGGRLHPEKVFLAPGD